MKILITSLFSLLFFLTIGFSQPDVFPCSFEEVMKSQSNPEVLIEQKENEAFIQEFIKKMRSGALKPKQDPYVIPVVLHVFHWGENGKIDLAQAQSGIDVLNDDFNGRNEGWNTVKSEFDSIKASLNIEFCLAKIDPDGNPTTGVNYYEDQNLVYNDGDFYRYAWDNFKYLNIFLPKYVNDSTSNFTANATFPSQSGSMSGRDRILYSSIRWGFGSRSQHAPGDDWASVGTHEAGHWLNLYHTFSNGCSFPGDYVDDTPPVQGVGIVLAGCDNNDLTCGVPANGSNFMDYNHGCKKMFTKGQVERMTAALHLPMRETLWSQTNLEATGCAPPPTKTLDLTNQNEVRVYPNPANEILNFMFEKTPVRLMIIDAFGKIIVDEKIYNTEVSINTGSFKRGIFFYKIETQERILSGKFLLK